MKDTVVFSSPFKGEAGRGMGFDDLVCRPSRCFFLPHSHPDPLKGRERHSCDCHATNAHGHERPPAENETRENKVSVEANAGIIGVKRSGRN